MSDVIPENVLNVLPLLFKYFVNFMEDRTFFKAL